MFIFDHSTDPMESHYLNNHCQWMGYQYGWDTVLYLVSSTSSYNHNSLMDLVLRKLVNCISEVPDTRYSTD